MVVSRLPRVIQEVISQAVVRLTRPQRGQLAMVLTALLIGVGAKLNRIPGAVNSSRHRTSVGRFLSQSDWDETGLLDGAVQRCLKSLRLTKRDVIHLVIDDTRIVKRGRKMDDVSKLWDHTHQQFAHGHTVVTAALYVRGLTLPWRFVVWQAKRWAGRAYRKPTEIAADLIRDFQPPKGVAVRVLFDAFYLCPTVTKACASRGFLWYSVSMKNRRLTRTGRGKSGLLKHLGPGILKHRGQKIRMQRDRGWRGMRIAAVDGQLKGIGSVRVVFSKRPRDSWRNLLAIATNDMNRSARQIIEIYERRWSIEVLFKELRGLGLGQYQMLRRNGIHRHLVLVGLAHLTLTRHALQRLDAPARKHTRIPLPRCQERLADFRQSIRHDQIQALTQRIRHAPTRNQLRQALLVM